MADHRLFAAAYDRMMAPCEAHGLAERRRRLLANAWGRVLEIGAGTGTNLQHYPAGDVASIVALEPDGAMRRRLERKVRQAPFPVEVIGRAVDDADLEDGSVDTVVTALVLCSVPDADRAAGAVRRWLRPDGRLLFLEHVHAAGLRGRVQHAVTPIWQRVAAGCHLDRDSVGALRRAGLVVTDLEHFTLPGGGLVFGNTVQGVARRRSAAREAVA